MLNILLSTGAIAGIAAGGAVALIAICLLLYFLVFKHFRYKKQVDELERKFEYLHGLLTGQDARWMRQIEQIASSNLLFVSRHQTFEKRFKDLRDKGDASAQKAINDLLSMLSDHDYKALKEALPGARRTIAEFDDAANSLHNDLNALIKPEEDCRAAAYAVKEKFRAIKQDYNVKSSELSLCSASFEAVFAKLEDMFTKFEKLVSCAQYEDANAIIPEVDRVLDELSKAIAELPNICVSIQTVIPDKLLSLENRYEEMASSGYPLQHLLTKADIEELRRQLGLLANDVKAFKRAHAQNRLDAIQAQIEGYFDAFEKEKDCRVRYDSECQKVYTDSGEVEKKYTRLCSALPEVQKIYVISEEQLDNFNKIKNLINKMGATKRSFDTLIHSPTKQPYSALVDKMDCLRQEAEEANGAIEDFNRYLLSLKSDSESGLAKVKGYAVALADAKFTVRQMDLHSIDAKYMPRIEECLGYVDDIYTALSKMPIDVAAINESAFKLSKVGDEALSGIKRDYEAMLAADAELTYANRDRFGLSDLDAQLRQAEEFYRKGEFEKAYLQSKESLKRIRGE